MRANTDRAPGVHLVTDAVGRRVAVPPVSPEHDGDHLDFETDVPELVTVALKGRLTAGLGVQLLAEPVKDGRTFITLALDGETETFEVPADRALDAFDHPFCYGGTLL